jgi:hypothetical protein
MKGVADRGGGGVEKGAAMRRQGTRQHSREEKAPAAVPAPSAAAPAMTCSARDATHPHTHAHKAVPDTRPITGNHCWILQPLSDLIDHFLLPMAKLTNNYTSGID